MAGLVHFLLTRSRNWVLGDSRTIVTGDLRVCEFPVAHDEILKSGAVSQRVILTNIEHSGGQFWEFFWPLCSVKDVAYQRHTILLPLTTGQ